MHTVDDARARAPQVIASRTATTAHLFTVDVEEYFQVSAMESVVDRAAWAQLPTRVEESVDWLLDRLRAHEVSGTFFILGWIAERHQRLVQRIAAAGHEIASHGDSHRRVTTLLPHEFRAEIRRSKQILEDVSGQRVRGYRAPSFSIVPGREWALDLLLEEGYEYDSSLFPVRRPGYGYPDATPIPHGIERLHGTLHEYPPTTIEVAGLRLPAAGGAYFRILPLSLTLHALRARTRAHQPAIFYLHPWELDPDQPRLPVSRLTRIRHYAGLNATRARLERVLEEFAFTTIGHHLDSSTRTPLLLRQAL